MEDREEALFEQEKRASTAQVLFKCARLLNERAIARVRERTGLTTFRTAHTSLFPHIDLEGTRITDLSRRLGISKQAVAQLVDELEEMEVLERVPDPTDGRAKLVRFHGSGATSLMAGLAVLRQVETELADEIGTDEMRSLHELLTSLLEVLERPS